MVKVKGIKKDQITKIKTNKVKKKTQLDIKAVKLATAIKKNKDVILSDSLPKKKSKLVIPLDEKREKTKTSKISSKYNATELTKRPKLVIPLENKSNKIKINKTAKHKTESISPQRKIERNSKKAKIGNRDDELRTNLKTKFNIRIEDVINAVDGLLKLRKTNPKLEKQLLSEDRAALSLQISCHQIPKGHSKIFKIPLQNSVLTPEDEICLIVPEVRGIGNKDHEKHIEHYENLLKSKNINNIKTIMTCHQLRTEYDTFEQKLRLADLYDIFLVNGKVSGKVVKMCGKTFYKKRKVPISVKLQATNLEEHIETALKKVPLFLHLKGNSFSVQFGHTDMTVDAMVNNIYGILEYLDQHFPGKFQNIKGIHAFLAMAGSIPIYMSLSNSNDIPRPIQKPKKPKAYKSVSGELTTLPNAEVTVMPSGRVIVTRTKGDNEDEPIENVITDQDIFDNNKFTTDSENGEQEEGYQEKANKQKKDKKRRIGVSALVDAGTENDINKGNKKEKISKLKRTKPNKIIENITPSVSGEVKIERKKKSKRTCEDERNENQLKRIKSKSKKTSDLTDFTKGLSKTRNSKTNKVEVMGKKIKKKNS